MRISLTDTQRSALAAQGVVMDEAGFLRSARGREVSAGVAVSLLKDAGPQHGDHLVQPSQFRRGRLTEGHQALSTAPAGIVDGPAQARVARTGRAGPAGPLGSGTADRSMDDDGDDDGTRLVPGDDIDGWGDGGPAVMAKGMVPDRFMRGYLTQGHAAQSPSVADARGTTAIPDSGPAEPEDFGRRYPAAGHATPSPANRPPNNPNPPGSSAAAVYASGARACTENQTLSRTEHVMPSGSVVSTTAASRMAVPSDMRASDVPHSVAM